MLLGAYQLNLSVITSWGTGYFLAYWRTLSSNNFASFFDLLDASHRPSRANCLSLWGVPYKLPPVRTEFIILHLCPWHGDFQAH